MTLCSVCGQIAATVPCYDGAHRCLPCAAAAGFEWRPDDALSDAELYREIDDPPPAPPHGDPSAERLPT